MAVVKLTKKDDLDKLLAQLILRLGRKVSQQDVLDACITIASKDLDRLAMYFTQDRLPTKKQVQEIITQAEDFNYDDTHSIDEDIYGK